jgi:hypothetical protein
VPDQDAARLRQRPLPPHRLDAARDLPVRFTGALGLPYIHYTRICHLTDAHCAVLLALRDHSCLMALIGMHALSVSGVGDTAPMKPNTAGLCWSF